MPANTDTRSKVLKHNKKYTPTDPLLDMHEVAEYLHMSHIWVKKNWAKEKLTPIKVGTRTLRWRLSTVENYLSKPKTA